MDGIQNRCLLAGLAEWQRPPLRSTRTLPALVNCTLPTLRFHISSHRPVTGRLDLLLSKCSLGLVPDAKPSIHGPQPLWGVENATAAFDRLLGLGAKALEPVVEVGEGIKVAAVTDPFGNRFGIIENPHFDTGVVQ